VNFTRNGNNHSPDSVDFRVLIVDDEPDIRSALRRILLLEGYHAEEAGSGSEALNLLSQRTYHLLLLDLCLPDLDGLNILEQAGREYPELLFVILTGHGTLQSAIMAAKFESVVDYLLKPVHIHEIAEAVTRAVQKQAERIRQQQLLEAAGFILEAASQLDLSSAPTGSPPASASTLPASNGNNHTNGQAVPQRYLSVPPLLLDRQKRLVTIQSNPSALGVELTKGETAVLACLMQHPGQILSWEELVSQAWGYEVGEFEAKSIIRPHILRLRQKVEANPKEPQLIDTVRRRGYRLNENAYNHHNGSAPAQH
jgi:DNA-binding response OmpR family regulator